jgi:hypothetical protein
MFSRGDGDASEYHTRPLVLGEGDSPLRLWGDRPRLTCGGDASGARIFFLIGVGFEH